MLDYSANRRMTHGLEYSVAYTWSKALDTADAYNSSISTLQNRNEFCGPASFDRTQNFVASYIYNFPKLARASFLDNRVGHVVLNGWEFSGFTTLTSGAPVSISYSGVSSTKLNREVTGSETIGPRPVLTGNPNLSPGDRNIYAWFNRAVVLPAVRRSQRTDSALRPLRGPGVNDFDLSLFKNIYYAHGEGRYIQLRCESLNALNKTQWSGINTSAIFNAAGVITNLPTAEGGRFGFGAANAVRSARIVPLAAKFYF